MLTSYSLSHCYDLSRKHEGNFWIAESVPRFNRRHILGILGLVFEYGKRVRQIYLNFLKSDSEQVYCFFVLSRYPRRC